MSLNLRPSHRDRFEFTRCSTSINNTKHCIIGWIPLKSIIAIYRIFNILLIRIFIYERAHSINFFVIHLSRCMSYIFRSIILNLSITMYRKNRLEINIFRKAQIPQVLLTKSTSRIRHIYDIYVTNFLLLSQHLRHFFRH